jgi:hypothetical protein
MKGDRGGKNEKKSSSRRDARADFGDSPLCLHPRPAQNCKDGNPPGQPQQDRQQSKIFQGKITKLQDGTYALVTGQTPQGQMTGHRLDNQDGAKKYEGKQVKVTETLELASNTIHVIKIEEA